MVELLKIKQNKRELTSMNMRSSYFYDDFTDRYIGAGPLGNVLPVSTDGLTNVIRGLVGQLYSTNINAQTLLCPTTGTTGLNIAGDQTNGDGFEINLSEPAQADARFQFKIDTETVGFFIEAQFTPSDVSGITELLVGFRKLAAHANARATYTDYFYAGLIGADIKIATDLNDAGETLTDTTDNGADATAIKIRVEVTSAGKVTVKVNDLDPTVQPTQYKFDTGDVVVPSIRFIQASDLCDTLVMNSLEVGYLN